MRMVFSAMALIVLVTGLGSTTKAGAVPIELWRLDCGKIRVDDLNDFSDTYAYTGQSKVLVASCYLIRHGNEYMLWDLGLPKSDRGLPLLGTGSKGETFSATIVEQLATLGVAPTRVSIVGISHYRFDHTGQAEDFPQARLLMGRSDVQLLRAGANPDAAPLTHWLKGTGRLEEVAGDKDVFGDGSVVMLNLPGHTPGHHGLLIKLPTSGYVVMTGDAAHFRENYESNGLPAWNSDRAQSLASLDRVRQIVHNLHALLILQHEPGDVDKLPSLPHSLN
jgi:N-acyl homoserine lactone hydrolase